MKEIKDSETLAKLLGTYSANLGSDFKIVKREDGILELRGNNKVVEYNLTNQTFDNEYQIINLPPPNTSPYASYIRLEYMINKWLMTGRELELPEDEFPRCTWSYFGKSILIGRGNSKTAINIFHVDMGFISVYFFDYNITEKNDEDIIMEDTQNHYATGILKVKDPEYEKSKIYLKMFPL